MAKGQDIPYQLRPNKFIDRQLFLDLLSQVCATKGPSNYTYASMGGKHLVDQESVYRRIGIDNLFSFDGSGWIVRRQQKNAPHAKTVCQKMHSSALPGSVDTLAALFAPASSFVFWLDYTDADRLAQLQELSQLLQKCAPGDVVRITMNSDERTLQGPWKKKGFTGPSEFRTDLLKTQLAEFYPVRLKIVREGNVPQALALAVSLAASQAAQASQLHYQPILLTTYADGLRMFTATILVMENSQEELPEALRAWEFTPSDWQDITDISAPDLSMREKILIDQNLHRSPSEAMKQVGFELAEDHSEALRAVESYQKLHRYYPTFYAIGIQ